EGLQEHAREVGNYLKKLLNELQKTHPLIADVRGNGLFLGIELVDGSQKPNTKLAAHIKNSLREKHILVSTDGPYDNVIKIKPPLSFNKEDAQTLVSALTSIFRNLG
ncbi:MAG: aminotransferase class III-fold pyridoxal phosphate-dependent enzyme, partial [Flavobacteriaceae bacterium]